MLKEVWKSNFQQHGQMKWKAEIGRAKAEKRKERKRKEEKRREEKRRRTKIKEEKGRRKTTMGAKRWERCEMLCFSTDWWPRRVEKKAR